MEHDAVRIDLNTADVGSLTKLSGIGPALAQQIVAARPLAAVDDLRQIRGIGQALVEQLRPLVWVSGTAEPAVETKPSLPPVETEAEPVAEGEMLDAVATSPPETLEGTRLEEIWPAEALAEEVPLPSEEELAVEAEAALEEMESDLPQDEVLEEMVAPLLDKARLEADAPDLAPAPVEPPAPVVPPATREPAAMSRALGCRYTVLSALLGAVLGLALSLGFLSNLNEGSLRYVPSSEMLQVRQEIDQLRTRADTIAGEVEGLRRRVDNLDTLGQEVTLQGETLDQLESATAQLEESIAAASAQLESLSQEVAPIAAQVETLQAQSEQFQSFLAGLRDLMSGLFSLEEQ